MTWNNEFSKLTQSPLTRPHPSSRMAKKSTSTTFTAWLMNLWIGSGKLVVKEQGGARQMKLLRLKINPNPSDGWND